MNMIELFLYNDVKINKYFLLTEIGYKNETINVFSTIALEYHGLFNFVCGEMYEINSDVFWR